MQGSEMDIARNVKVVDRLKADLAGALAHLYQALLKAEKEEALAALVDLNVYTMLLTKRLGYPMGKLETKTAARIAALIKEGHPSEEYGELTALKEYFAIKR